MSAMALSCACCSLGVIFCDSFAISSITLAAVSALKAAAGDAASALTIPTSVACSTFSAFCALREISTGALSEYTRSTLVEFVLAGLASSFAATIIGENACRLGMLKVACGAANAFALVT